MLTDQKGREGGGGGGGGIIIPISPEWRTSSAFWPLSNGQTTAKIRLNRVLIGPHSMAIACSPCMYSTRLSGLVLNGGKTVC